MFRLKVSLITIVAILLANWVVIAPAWAQSPSASLPSETADYEATKTQLLTLYSNQVQSYQTAYRGYTLATAQYDKLKTLTALGELVNSTKETMLKRGDVLVTYVDILYLELREVKYVESEVKQDLLRRLEAAHQSFLNQQTLISNSQDYQAINERAEAFIELITQFESLSIETKAAIHQAKIIVADEDSRQFYQQISQYYLDNPVTGFQAVERQRAKEEIDRAFEQQSVLWSKLDKLVLDEKDVATQGWYSQILTALSALQNQLLIIFSYLEEASRL